VYADDDYFFCDFLVLEKSIPLVGAYQTHVPEMVKHFRLGIIGVLFSWFVWWLVRITMNRCTMTMSTSVQLLQELGEHGVVNEKELWRKGVDTELFHPRKYSPEMRKKLAPDPDKVLLLYAGRMSHEKSLDFLDKVLDHERLRGKIHLTLIGDGPARKDLEKLFAHRNDEVSFIDFIPAEELAYAYASADIFVFPSTTETLGLVALEANAAGLPVVGVAARGLITTIKPGETGFLYPPGDVDQAASHLASLVNDSELRKRISKSARADVEQWSWEKSVQELVGTYKRTIQLYESKKPKLKKN